MVGSGVRSRSRSLTGLRPRLAAALPTPVRAVHALATRGGSALSAGHLPSCRNPVLSPHRAFFLVDLLFAEQRPRRHLFVRQPEHAASAHSRSDDQGLWADFHLARNPRETYVGEHWPETLADNGWSPQLHSYQPGGQDQFCLADDNPDDAKALMVWPVPSNARSKLNLNLMRRGPNFDSSSRCLDLVDAAVATFQRRKHELIAVHQSMP